MLAGSIGAVFLTTWTAQAQDMGRKDMGWNKALASYGKNALPAVDGLNGKAEVFGGTLAKKQLWGGLGSVTVPLGGSYGFQVDGFVGKYDHRGMQAVAGHWFWRNPASGLVGLYGSFANWNSGFGQVHLGQVAFEGAWYWNRLTIEGVAGVEFGNTASGQVGSVINTIDIDTRFFDKINVSYYFLDNLKAFVGHRYLGGKHAAAFGAELAVPIPRSTAMASLFVEGRAGEYTGVWGGLKLYFGKSDKTLIRRHREDDPVPWEPESGASMGNQQTQTTVGPSGPPPPPPPE
jgi:hypothetical protein